MQTRTNLSKAGAHPTKLIYPFVALFDQANVTSARDISTYPQGLNGATPALQGTGGAQDKPSRMQCCAAWNRLLLRIKAGRTKA